MAANFMNPQDAGKIIQRIVDLDPQCQARWGKMNSMQMLDHCGLQLKLGLGIIEQTTSEGPAIMRTRMWSWLSLYAFPWPRGFATPAKMNMMKNQVEVSDFQAGKEQLLELLKQVQQKPKLLPHQFFGALNEKDWGRMIWKHLNHHLRQFGG